jgi:hypothetical protein
MTILLGGAIHAFLYDCYEQAHQMGVLAFDNKGCPIEVEHENKA